MLLKSQRNNPIGQVEYVNPHLDGQRAGRVDFFASEVSRFGLANFISCGAQWTHLHDEANNIDVVTNKKDHDGDTKQSQIELNLSPRLEQN